MNANIVNIQMKKISIFKVQQINELNGLIHVLDSFFLLFFNIQEGIYTPQMVR